MKTVYLNPENLQRYQQQAGPCVIALGFFDGVHKGHQQVIQAARNVAREKGVSLAVMSFFPHPKEVLTNGSQQVDYLMPVKEKQRIFKELGVDIAYIVEFNSSFSALSPEQFVQKYLLGLGAIHAVAGFDFTYGCRGAGNMKRMKEDSGGLLEVTQIEKIAADNEKISSTLIRKTIRAGEMDKIPTYLGEYYSIKGQMLLKKHTAAVQVEPYYLLPAPGVYEVRIKSRFDYKQAEVIVTEEPGLIYLPSLNKREVSRYRYVTVEWKRCLSKGLSSRYYYASEKALSTG
ncbi:FAD synthetase family protein [Bacillus thermotolerans]|mgnify:CR=1 FL=1|uniref:FAD synthase n=1 Tax=Bacillus thermotolerans TaxID=1221996 RepID=A0A0F5I251_BACTR|nr:FAD synthetase family protein [Bacillus thermotolerans]KKB39591.1 Riboflavin kinase / FMN adenylyltransferase [Bacillus thermotolerans]